MWSGTENWSRWTRRKWPWAPGSSSSPGEKVPIDGRVVEGRSSLDTAALTGESLPREAGTGDEVISGCINLSGVLTIETTKEFGESTVSRILDLVEDASSRKAKSEVFITKFARVYTPAVCSAALALFLLPPLVRMALGMAPLWHMWLYRSLLFLVVSCPCALVLSIPLSFFAGIGGASRQGILIKGSNYMETLAHTAYVVMDKTGTLTQGVFEVSAVHHNKLEEKTGAGNGGPGGMCLQPSHQQKPPAGLRQSPSTGAG